jgi:hypothetical protein
MGFFAALTTFSGYKVVTALSPTVPPIGGWLKEERAYGLVSLAFVVGAVFLFFRGNRSTNELLITLAGVVFFGAGMIVFFARARRP